MENPKIDESGISYYETLPDYFRVATADDFKNIPYLCSIQKPYLILGDHWPVYQCCRVSFHFSIKNIRYWLDKDKVFVLKDKNCT